MKKIISIILCVTVIALSVFAISGCKTKEEWADTIMDLADF